MIKQPTEQLQHWLKDVIISHGNLPQKLFNAQQRNGLHVSEVVADEGKASVFARLNVYTSGYMLRLLECLAADFPVLKKFVGDEVFDAFANGSISWQPSSSYTLYDLGKNFIQFLESTKPPPSNTPESKMLDLPIELAKLERMRQEAIRSAGTETQEKMPAIWLETILFSAPTMIIATPQCLRLAELKYPLKKFFADVNQSTDHQYQLPQPAQTFMAVSRKNYRVTMEELPEWQYLFLQLCANGLQLVEAAAKTAVASKRSAGEIMAELYILLPLLLDNGFITIIN
jgi:hypothetical protein